jgi:hypothetical protein
LGGCTVVSNPVKANTIDGDHHQPIEEPPTQHLRRHPDLPYCFVTTNRRRTEMTRKSDEQVFSLYRERFGVELQHPPLDYGVRMVTSDLVRYARQALAADKPIDWSEHFEPLPPGTES